MTRTTEQYEVLWPEPRRDDIRGRGVSQFEYRGRLDEQQQRPDDEGGA